MATSNSTPACLPGYVIAGIDFSLPRIFADAFCQAWADAVCSSKPVDSAEIDLLHQLLWISAREQLLEYVKTGKVVARDINGVRLAHGQTLRASANGVLTFYCKGSELLAFAQAELSSISAKDIPEKASPVSATKAQETAVLGCLENMGYDPAALPQRTSGKKGVKAKVREALGTRGMWAKTSVFDKTWQRLRDRNVIKDVG
ncbi:hypothetical protein [Silvimonas sp.]|uniref:hypothetical protein n=1 Tax=Silvimonas sp. TaxID=2650811 RepID=UPI002843C1F6|nr:hypothetical protein [Silvimonas sp.]MDR3429597.1 hypothetical protein [Silvimonas sp.]